MARAWCICLAILITFVLAYGQAMASLRGLVTDPTGAVIPGAVLTLTNSGTGLKRQGLSGEDGVYQFLQIPPGTYEVKVEKGGFATTTRENVQLQINTPATLDLRMDLGNTAEVVNVEADATAINTVDAPIGNPFSD